MGEGGDEREEGARRQRGVEGASHRGRGRKNGMGAFQGGACGLLKDELIPDDTGARPRRRPGLRGGQARPPPRARPPLLLRLPPSAASPPARPPGRRPGAPRPAHLPLPYVLPSRYNKVASTSCTRRGAGPGGPGAGGGPGPARSPAAAAAAAGQGGGSGERGPGRAEVGSGLAAPPPPRLGYRLRQPLRAAAAWGASGGADRGGASELRHGAGRGAGERRNGPARPRPVRGPLRPLPRPSSPGPAPLLLSFIFSRATALLRVPRQIRNPKTAA